MKFDAVRKLRRELTADRPVYGLWVTLEAPSVTEMAVALGVDWVVIDAEHGHLDWKEVCEHVRAAARSDTVVLVRLAELSVGLVKRALDVGAEGVVVPWIETAEQLRQAVAFARYPPEGVRGIGAERATGWGECIVQHVNEANEHVLVVPIIESVKAGRNIQSLVAVAGTDLFLLGPADYSSSAGYRGQWEGPGVAQELLAIKDVIRAAGKHCGVVATSLENMAQRAAQGFRLIGMGMDAGLLLRSLHAALAAAGRDRRIGPSLVPEPTPRAKAPLARPPESFRPDRRESVTSVGHGPAAEIDRGVRFDCLVGRFNAARNLTTGLVTMSAGSRLRYHTHAYSESVTVLSGSAAIEVEGRRYALGPLDNIVIPRGLAHASSNLSAGDTVLHIAMPTESPSRVLIDKFFSQRAMPEESCGLPGAERVTRHRAALRFEAGAGATFIDYFNRDLVPGIEMSGGYGAFEPGGRLPAHIHDFDESICIIEGEAVCIVEGRRYALSACDTALEPRGRVHYFVNESNAMMGMIWVYAGPIPERIVVAEECCTVDGSPWK